MEGKNYLVNRIESKFQLLIAIAAFFPSFVYTAFKAVNQVEEKAMSNSLFFGILIALFLIDYVFFWMIDPNRLDKLNRKILDALDSLLLICLASFIIPISALLQADQALDWFTARMFQGSFWAVILIPSIIFLGLFGVIIFDIYLLLRDYGRKIIIKFFS